MNKTRGVVVYRYLIQVQYVFWITEEYRLSEISKVNFCDITMYFSSIVEFELDVENGAWRDEAFRQTWLLLSFKR